MSDRPSAATSATNVSSSNRKVIYDAGDAAWQQSAASLEHGCLKLGDDEAGEGNLELRSRQRTKYVTHYRINHEEQTSKLCSGVTMEECIPCCHCGKDEDDEDRPVSWIWYLIRSELMVFTLHISAVVFGVVKEALDFRHSDPTEALHFAHTVIETVATFLILVILMLNTRMGYVKVRQAVQRLEHFDPDKDAHLSAIKTWMWLAVAAGFLLIGVCVGCFIAFYAFVHLGWTVLSNQSCIVISLVIFGLYSSRVTAAVYKISIDQHKVVIYEAMMLLRDRCRDSDAEHDDAESRAAAVMFMESVKNTKSLSRPKYINMTCASQQHLC